MKDEVRLVYLALLFLLAVPPSAAAESSWSIEASAHHLEVGSGNSFHGNLTLFLLEQVLQTEPPAAGDFELRGNELHLEMDNAEPAVTIPRVTTFRPNYNTTFNNFQEFVVHGLRNRPFYEFIVAPQVGDSRISVTSSCGELASSTQESTVRDPWVVPEQNRPSIKIDTSEAMRWTNCSHDARLTITGDFMLCLWQWDFIVTSGDQSHDFQTGRLQPQSLGGGPDSTAVASRDQQAFLFVRNGTLTIRLPSAAPHELYAGSHGRLQAATGVQLVDASVLVPTKEGRQEFTGKKAGITGTLDLEILQAGVGQDLRMTIGGNVQGLQMDGQSLPLASVVLPGSSHAWVWMIGVAGAILVPGLLLPIQRRRRRLLPDRLEKIHHRADDHLACLRPEAARPLVLKLQDLQPSNGRWNHLHGKVLRDLGEFAEALQQQELALCRLQGAAPALVGECAFEAACAAARLHEQAPIDDCRMLADKVVNLLAYALAFKPSLADEAENHPELQPFIVQFRKSAGYS